MVKSHWRVGLCGHNEATQGDEAQGKCSAAAGRRHGRPHLKLEEGSGGGRACRQRGGEQVFSEGQQGAVQDASSTHRSPQHAACRTHLELLPLTLWVCEGSVERALSVLEPLAVALGVGEGKGERAKGNSSSHSQVSFHHLHRNHHNHHHQQQHNGRGGDGDGDHASVGSGMGGVQGGLSGQEGEKGERCLEAPQPELELTLSVPHVCVVGIVAAGAGRKREYGAHQGSPPRDEQEEQQQQQQQQQDGCGKRGWDGGRSGEHGRPQQGDQQQDMQQEDEQQLSFSNGSLKAAYIALDLTCGSHHPHVSLQRLPPHRGVPLIRWVMGIIVWLCHVMFRHLICHVMFRHLIRWVMGNIVWLCHVMFRHLVPVIRFGCT